MHGNCVACQQPMQGLNVAVVVTSALPAHNVVVAAAVMRLFDDELELDPAEAAEHLIVQLGIPDVALAPDSFNARLAIRVRRIPVAEDGVAADDPNLLAVIRLVLDSDFDLFEANGPGWHGQPLRASAFLEKVHAPTLGRRGLHVRLGKSIQIRRRLALQVTVRCLGANPRRGRCHFSRN